jgi:hypothetical protein
LFFVWILALCDRSFSILVRRYSIIVVTASLLLNGGHAVQARAPTEGEQSALCVAYMNEKNKTNTMHYHCVRTGTEKMAKALRTKEGNSFKSSIFKVEVVISAKHISLTSKGESNSMVELQIGGAAAP